MARRAEAASGGSNYMPIGVAGLKHFSGFVFEEFNANLRGAQGRRVFQEMAENDDVVGAFLYAIDTVLRGVEWSFETEERSAAHDEAVEWAHDVVIDGLGQSFEDFVSEVLTMLVYGWSLFEVVYGKREDGTIGLDPKGGLEPRAQDSLVKWEFDERGNVIAFKQRDPVRGFELTIPFSRFLLFRTVSRKNNPEGRSILRSAYLSWQKKKNLQEIEAIGIERDLSGVPVVRVPSVILTDAKYADVKAQYEQIAKDLRFNHQAGLVLPSEVWKDPQGSPTSTRMYEVELLSSTSARTVSTDTVIKRYEQGIARSVLAEFLLLGQNAVGSLALSRSKTDLFLRSLQAVLNAIAGVINRFLMPRLWSINGFDIATMPALKPGRVAPVDLAEVGEFIAKLTGAGATMFPDDQLEDELRTAAGLPPKVEGEVDAALEAEERKVKEKSKGKRRQAENPEDDEVAEEE